jgi:hypothetical protein
MKPGAAVAAALLLFACGGRTTRNGATADGGVQDDGGSAADVSTSENDAWTACTGPDQAEICGGSATACANNLTSPACDCLVLGTISATGGVVPPDDLSICNQTSTMVRYRRCRDGEVMVAVPASAFDAAMMPLAADYICAPFEDAMLYANNGWARAAIYADFSDFTSTALPVEADCPTIEGVTLCGGPCGTCDTGLFCTGRSPLHPYSFCAPDFDGNSSVSADGLHGVSSCGPGYGCFAFKDQADAQPRAGDEAYCLPTAMCEAAINIPGGGLCEANGSLPGGWTDCFPQ